MISYISAFLLAALSSAACFFITRYFITKDQQAWKTDFGKLEKEHAKLEKTVKREQKKVTRLTEQADAWKEKFEASEKNYVPKVKGLTADVKELEANLETRDAMINRLETDKGHVQAKVEQLQKNLATQKEKYNTDLGDSKGWKTRREQLNGELKDIKSKMARTLRENEELKSRIQLQRNQITEAETIKKTFRKLKTSNKKLSEDLAYWEKKHYDVHHRVVEMDKEIESLKKQNHELQQLNNGGEILRQNLLKKIEEFKTKFVNVNNSYHELKNKMPNV